MLLLVLVLAISGCSKEDQSVLVSFLVLLVIALIIGKKKKDPPKGDQTHIIIYRRKL